MMSTGRFFAAAIALFCLLIASLPWCRQALGQDPLDLKQEIALTPGGDWQILWNTDPGEEYTLQRSTDLQSWENVMTLTAPGATASYVDTEVEDEPVVLWRVLGPDGEPGVPIKISDIVPSLSASPSAEASPLGVVIEAEEPIATVKYFDGDAELGAARPTLGGGWLFDLGQDPAQPRVLQLSIEVTTASGETVRTPTKGILVADTSKFVPLQPRTAPQVKDGFVSVSGALIEADASGALDPFLYFPEGFSDPAQTTGAHFAFAQGATLVESNGATLIEFVEADFHRSADDTAPYASQPGTHQLDLANVAASWIQDHFTIPNNGPVELLWGGVPVTWQNGALGVDGWGNLEVAPPLGDFPLPAFSTRVQIRVDPETEEAHLLVCFHGEWVPMPDSDLSFRIPQADPLKVYLSSSGHLRAHGTLDVVFPDGAELRGSVSWQDPIFEVRIEGKGFTLPAISTLRDLVPANPLANLPDGNSEAEMDALADRLLAYRNIYRNLATSGLKNASFDDVTEYLPEAAPREIAGSVLEAWAWRVRSWGSDRAGDNLSPEAVEELSQLVQGACQTAEAAHDLPTVLKLLHDLLLLRSRVGEAVSAGALTGLEATLLEAENAIFNASERVITNAAQIDANPGSLALVVSLMEKVSRAAQEAETAAQANGIQAAEGDSPVLRARRVFDVLSSKFQFRFFLDNELVRLSTMSPNELLGFLRTLERYYVSTINRSASPQRQADLAALESGRDQAYDAFLAVQNTLALEQINRGNYSGLFQALEERGQFLRLMKQLDRAIQAQSGEFNPSTADVLNAMLDLRGLRPASAQVLDCGRFEKLVDFIGGGTESLTLGQALLRAQESLESCLNQQHGACGLLEQELGTPELNWTASQFGSFSGKYESVAEANAAWNAATAYGNLQINQGGTYIQGWFQEQTGDFQTAFSFEGLLHSTGTENGLPYLEFRIRTQQENLGTGGDYPTRRGWLRVIQSGDNFSIRLTSGDVHPTEYQRISRAPAFSDSIIATFPESRRADIRSALRYPLHSKIVQEIIVRLNTFRTQEQIDDEAQLIPRSVKEALKLYFAPNTPNPNAMAIIADGFIGAILGHPEFPDADNPDPIRTGGIVTKQQYNAARLLITQVLERDREFFFTTVAGGGLNPVERSYWNALNALVYSADEALELPFLERLTGVAREEYATGDLFHYIFSIKQKAVGAVTLGGASLEVTITKQYPENAPQADETFEFDGDFWGLSRGLGGGVVIGTTTSDPVPSPFNYSAEQLAGTCALGQFSANIAIGGFGLTAGRSSFTFDGNRELPPLTFWTTSILDPIKGLAASVGYDTWIGQIIEQGSELNFRPTDIQYTANGHPDLPDAVFFDIGHPTLTDCGRQALQMFVAEHLAVVGSYGATIEIEGYTDRTGSTETNLTLSRDRATNVKNALVEIMGSSLRISPETITPLGRGEEQAALDGLPDDDPNAPNPQANNPAYRRAEIRVTGLVRATVQER